MRAKREAPQAEPYRVGRLAAVRLVTEAVEVEVRVLQDAAAGAVLRWVAAMPAELGPPRVPARPARLAAPARPARRR